VRDTTFKAGRARKIFSSGYEGSHVVPACPARGIFERG
jgi:hypothetical protein